jgi:hypothetical protein
LNYRQRQTGINADLKLMIRKRSRSSLVIVAPIICPLQAGQNVLRRVCQGVEVFTEVAFATVDQNGNIRFILEWFSKPG